MTEIKGMIFDIKRFAVHDGPGIRTTIFFKGCPLNCSWCHNPEGISSKNEIFFYDYRCLACSKCIDICPTDAIHNVNRTIITDSALCSLCEKCVDICPTTARTLIGKEMKISELTDQLEKDMIYYGSSNGGVTISGGEPFHQPAFLKHILQYCRNKNVHTAVDTSGYAAADAFSVLIKDIDLLLYDLKISNDAQHRKYTGVSNDIIKHNLKTASMHKLDIILRIPVIPGITDTDDNVQGLIAFISNIKGIHKIELMPFHNVEEKYRRLGKKYYMENLSAPSPQKIKEMANIFENNGFQVTY